MPPITHLQFLVLGTLLSRERAGRVIRETIAGYGVRSSAAAFYQMMARLERDDLIEGWYEQIKVGDQAVTERRYRILSAGTKLWTQTRAFYESVVVESAEEGWSNA